MSKNKSSLFLILFFLAFSAAAFGQEPQAQAPKENREITASAKSPAKFIYDAKGKRNPFIPLVTSDGRICKMAEEEASGGLLLEGIIYDKNGLSYAMLNGQVVKVGESVKDYQIYRIEENKVHLTKDGELFELGLKKEE